MPVHLVVDGIGLEELTGPYDSSPSLAETALPTAVSFLVVAPLISAICIHAIHASAAGTPPRAREALQSGLDAFAPIFLAVVLAGIGISIGLVLLVVPGVFLAVRWYFVPQAVMVDGARGTRALTRSGELVRGHWWRTFGLLVAANLAAVIPGVILVTPSRPSPRAPTARCGPWWARWPPRRSPRPSWRCSPRCSTTTCAARAAGARAWRETALGSGRDWTSD